MYIRTALCVLAVAGMSALAQRRVGVEQLWETNCSKCHGEKGEGGGAGTRTLLTDDLYDPLRGNEIDRRFFDATKNGQPDTAMPGFGETLNDAQVWALVNHIREKQAAERRARLGSPKAVNGVFATARESFRIETVVGAGLEVPWAVEFLPDGRLLITERKGTLRVFTPGADGGELSAPVTGTPLVRNNGQGGLMDVALHPIYTKPGHDWIYLAFTDPSSTEKPDSGPGMTRIVRGKLRTPTRDATTPSVRLPSAWVEQQTIFEAKREHYINSGLHFGCKIAFQGPVVDEMYHLYFSIGERGNADMAQDVTRPNGKVHRVWDDGQIPKDNPFAAREDAYRTIWSFGHRNPQGLIFDLAGNLWDTEHGPRGGDELNLIRKGANYGWPTVSYGMNYTGSPLVTPWPDVVWNNGRGHSGNVADIAMPTFRWMPSIGACGLTVVQGGAKGEAFPSWRGDLLAGGLSGQNVDRLRVEVGKDGVGRVIEREEIVHGRGRVRDVRVGPDGSVYVVLNGPDRVIRLVPVPRSTKPGE